MAAAAGMWDLPDDLPKLPDLPRSQLPSGPGDGGPPGRPWGAIILALLLSLMHAYSAWSKAAQGYPQWAVAMHIPAAFFAGVFALLLMI
jgi:hypothetical protein